MRIGVLGGGQLGRMMALAGYPLGLRLRFFDRAANAPAGQVAECFTGSFDDLDALARFANGLDLITYEFENVPAGTARYLAEQVRRFFPPPRALEIAQDRYIQKSFFRETGVPTAAFSPVSTRAELESAVEAIGLPAVLKTRRWGYDGKGQFVLRESADLDRAWQIMDGSPAILESFVHFSREVSVIAARSVSGQGAFYPLTENHHREGILRLSLAPAPGLSTELQQLAQSYAEKILTALDYAGALTLEMFEVDGKLLANEMATRVHNSGHWTIEGAETSQFENHLRAITGLPLGSTEARGCSAMVNFIGSLPEAAPVLAIPGAHLHVYGKKARPGRKLGHATLCLPDPQELNERLEKLLQLAGC
ncbi:MAG: 5-(carboxyamino)imidazole ribonucleotide synthase [Terriglobia bacterium]